MAIFVKGKGGLERRCKGGEVIMYGKYHA